MNILLYEPNGGSSYIYELAASLSGDNSVSLTVPSYRDWITRRGAGEWAVSILKEIPAGAPGHEKLLLRLYNNFQAIREARSLGPEILHYHLFSYPLLDYPVSSLQKSSSLVLTIHNVVPHGSSPSRRTLGRRLMINRAEQVIVHHKTLKRTLNDLYDIPLCRINVIPRGIPEGGTVSESDLSRKEARAELGLKDSEFGVLCFGPMRESKRVDYLVQSLQNLPNEVVLILAGMRGYWGDRLPDLVEGVGADSRVRMRLGHIRRESVGKFFKASDLVALPYEDFYGQSANMLTAYKFGRPLLVSPGNAPAMTVEEEGTGVVIHELSPDAIAAGIEHAMAEGAPDAYNRSISEARRRYTWSTVSSRTVGVYRDALD